MDQLTLGIRLQEEANFESFYAGDNEEIIVSLKAAISSAKWQYIYLWGNESFGKSHLLQACCHLAVNQGLSAFYLPLSTSLSPAILEGLENFSLVCLDDVNLVAGHAVWEEALFHFFNATMQKNVRLVIAGSAKPGNLGFKLSDLISRLTFGVAYFIKPLSDHQKLVALQLRARLKGFILSDEVGRYLIYHYPRDIGSLLRLLAFLDEASLKLKHKITLPFVKAVLNELNEN